MITYVTAALQGVDFPFSPSPILRSGPRPFHALQGHLSSGMDIQHMVNLPKSPASKPLPEDIRDVSPGVPGDSRRRSSAVSRPISHCMMICRHWERSQGVVSLRPRLSVFIAPDNLKLIEIESGTTEPEFMIDIPVYQDLTGLVVVNKGNCVLAICPGGFVLRVIHQHVFSIS